MKSNQPEDEEDRKKRIRLERELKRNLLYVKKTDVSIPVSQDIIHKWIIDQGIGSYILEQKIKNDFIPYLICETISKMKSIVLKCVGEYDCEYEASPGEEPQQSTIDLWANEKVCNERPNSQMQINK